MSQDRVGNRNFKDLFSGPVRFIVPFFQRGYAWQRRQWDDLFIDVHEQILKEVEAGIPMEEVEHFFGPVVVQRRTVKKGEPPEYLIIDGQQRITTIYVLLGIIVKELASKHGGSLEAARCREQLEIYLENPTVDGDDYRRLKVFSSKGDRLPTYRAIFGEMERPASPLFEFDIHLFGSGQNQIEELVKYVERRMRYVYRDVESLWRLAQVALHCLKIVWIPLDEKRDDPQAIFESLNDRGMPLSAGELICSYLFRPLMEGDDFEKLHDTLWLESIKEAGSGPRFEDFLRHFFSIGERSMVGAGRKTYVHFKMRNRDLTAAQARKHLAAIRAAAPLYKFVDDPAAHPFPDPEIRQALYSIQQTRMDSPSPFLLAVLLAIEDGSLKIEKARAMFRETLTLLVRRKMAELPTTAYDKLFPNLLSRIAKATNVSKAIQDQFKKHDVWVSDEDFAEAFVRKPLYRTRDLAFGRMVLAELDRRLQSEDWSRDYSDMTVIEHAIPIELDRKWKEYLGADWRDDHMSIAVNTVGNLCLNVKASVPGDGSDPFQARAKGFAEFSSLARHFRRHRGHWGLEAIRKRSKALAKEAGEIWGWAGS